MALNLTKNCSYINKVSVLQNETHFFIIGKLALKEKYHIITIKKKIFTKENVEKEANHKLSDLLKEDKKEYNKREYKKFLDDLKSKDPTNVTKVSSSYGIFGFVKFLLGYYLILIQETSQIGKISKFIINRVDKFLFLPLFDSEQIKQELIYDLESKYIFTFKGIDFEKQVYFSYTYNLTKSLQRNFVENLKSQMLVGYEKNFLIKGTKKLDLKKVTNNCFLWNHHHIKEFFNCITNKKWCIYAIYGFFEQIECTIYGLRFLVSVIARRNRNFAGTRYLKRGINNDGNVANDVETEQILEEISTSCSDQPNISSFIHIRGSVPVYWHQEQISILPKPEIKINLTDYEFDATKRHFFLLSQRYGYPCLVCNLTKKKEGKKQQETLLNQWYEEGIDYINKNNSFHNDKKILYYHYDLKQLRQSSGFYKSYCDESCKLIQKTNMFCFIPQLLDNNTYMLSLQNGVIRSNCIDCLDRTNVYQQIIGTALMLIQLRNLGVEAVEPDNEYEEIYGILTEIYKKMGNVVSLQYGGSLAHKQTIKSNKTKMNKIINKVPELVNTFKRYFNNSFNDRDKQNAINLFLGKYKFNSGLPEIWEIANDTDLHKKKHLKKLSDDWEKEGIDYYTKFNLINDIIDNLGLIKNAQTKKDLINIGNIFYLDIIDKISITEYNKPIKILTSQGYKEYYSHYNDEIREKKTETYDYLIKLDKYLDFKKSHLLEYADEITYQKTEWIFSFLDIDPKEQIKTFESFSKQLPKQLNKGNDDNNLGSINSNIDNIWNIIDEHKEKDEPKDENKNILMLYDETVEKGIKSSQMFTEYYQSKKGEKKSSSIQNKQQTNNFEEVKQVTEKSKDFNICSFEIEEDLMKEIKEFVNPNFIDNAELCQIDDFSNDPLFLKVEKDDTDYSSIITDPTYYTDDMNDKIGVLDVDSGMWYYPESKKEARHLRKKISAKAKQGPKKKKVFGQVLQRVGVPIKIYDEHFA